MTTEPVVLATGDDHVIVTGDGSGIQVGAVEVSDYFTRMIMRVVPPWLSRGNGRILLQSIASMYDRLATETEASLEARFPSPDREDALALLGRDRVIIRGPMEDAESYASRLEGWLEAHRTRGGPYAMLGQLRAYYAGAMHRIDLVYASGARYVLWPDGSITFDSITWREDSDPSQWAQAWVIHHLDADPRPLSSSDEASHLLIPREWSAAHILPIEVVLMWPDAVQLWDYPAWEITWDELDALAIDWDDIEAVKIN